MVLSTLGTTSTKKTIRACVMMKKILIPDGGVKRQISRFGFSCASGMIVFSGPTVGPSRTDMEWSRLRNPLQEPIWIVQYENPQRVAVKPAELTKQKQVNLTDLANITIEVLCRLQQLYSNNNTQTEWVWELTGVNISDIVSALGLDGYVALSDVIYLPVWYKILMTTLFIVCLLWASFSNLRMLVAIGIRKTSWSSTNVLIGALALSDLLTVSCATPTEISVIIHDLNIWDYGPFGCVTLPFLQSAAILSNALILCLIAYDRYVCVVKMQPRQFNSNPGCHIIASIIIVWIVSIVVAMPSFWLWRVYYFILVDDVPDPEIGMDFCSVFPACQDNRNLNSQFFPIYHIVLCGAIFVPLFIFFTVLYGRIGHFLWIRTPIGTSDDSFNLHLAKKKRIAWALFWLVFWFFFCRMPNWIFVMVTMFQVDEEDTSAMLMIKSTLVFLSVLNTVVNPWLYSQLNESLKKTLRNCQDHSFCGYHCTFRSCCQVQPERPSSDSQRKLGPNQNEQLPQLAQEQPERRGSRVSQVEPIDILPEKQGVLALPTNEATIFTLQNKVVHADVVTRSSSKNGGKTRQTFLE